MKKGTAASLGTKANLRLQAPPIAGANRPNKDVGTNSQPTAELVAKRSEPVRASEPPFASTATKILNEAGTLRVNGDFLGAIAQARLAIPQLPQQAWMLIGAAACEMDSPDTQLAREAIKHLNSDGEEFVTRACRRSHVDPDFFRP